MNHPDRLAFKPDHPTDLPDKQQFVRRALAEAWDAYTHPRELTNDIDLIWAVSAPGTVSQAAHYDDSTNPYNNENFNLDIVNHAVDTVKKITALRVNKPLDQVTKDDIREHGPRLLYNGESPTTQKTMFPTQNDDFMRYCLAEDFPLPIENIVVCEIDVAYTPAQVQQLGHFLRENAETMICRKVAVVCGVPHLTRTGRYIEHYKDLFPEGIEFVPSPVTQGDDKKMSRLTAHEVRKALLYLANKHLAPDSTFYPQETISDPRQRNILRNTHHS